MPTPNGINGNGRDTNGRFIRGNPGGPGNPNARKVAALRRALFRSVKPEDLRQIVTAMVEAARGGDWTAAKLVLAYTLGNPTQSLQIQEMDDNRVRLRVEYVEKSNSMVSYDEFARAFEGYARGALRENQKNNASGAV